MGEGEAAEAELAINRVFSNTCHNVALLQERETSFSKVSRNSPPPSSAQVQRWRFCAWAAAALDLRSRVRKRNLRFISSLKSSSKPTAVPLFSLSTCPTMASENWRPASSSRPSARKRSCPRSRCWTWAKIRTSFPTPRRYLNFARR